MTGPALTTAAPSPDTAPDFTALDPMERTIQSTLHESRELIGDPPDGTDTTPAGERPRDDRGRFVAGADGEQAKPGEWQTIPDASQPNADPNAPAEGEDAAPEIPEGFVVVPELSADKIKTGGFKVFDAEGEIVPPDLTFELNFRGKDGSLQPRKLGIDQLANYARMGVYNHERDQQYQQTHVTNQQLTHRVTEVEGFARQLQQERTRLLSDPDYLMKQLQQHEADNTPEARERRATDEARLANQRAEYVQVAQIGERFLESEIAPALSTIVSTLPSVTQDELAQRLAWLIDGHKVRTPFGTTIDPRSYDSIRRLIVQDLVPWAQQVHLDRDTRTPAAREAPQETPAERKAKAEADAARVRSQKARRKGTTAIRPAGGSGRLAEPQTPQKPITSDRDMADFVIGRSVAQTVGRG